MATRSRIAIIDSTGTARSIYCHWDGYPAGVGATLTNHYTEASKVDGLMKLGDLSSLGAELGERHLFSCVGTDMALDHWEALYGNMCTAYGRDRGEDCVGSKTSDTFAEFLEQCDQCGAEYYYVFRDGAWYYGDMNTRKLEVL